jgi:hypothetical protein
VSKRLSWSCRKPGLHPLIKKKKIMIVFKHRNLQFK